MFFKDSAGFCTPLAAPGVWGPCPDAVAAIELAKLTVDVTLHDDETMTVS